MKSNERNSFKFSVSLRAFLTFWFRSNYSSSKQRFSIIVLYQFLLNKLTISEWSETAEGKKTMWVYALKSAAAVNPCLYSLRRREEIREEDKKSVCTSEPKALITQGTLLSTAIPRKQLSFSSPGSARISQMMTCCLLYLPQKHRGVHPTYFFPYWSAGVVLFFWFAISVNL